METMTMKKMMLLVVAAMRKNNAKNKKRSEQLRSTTWTRSIWLYLTTCIPAIHSMKMLERQENHHTLSNCITQ